MSLESAREFAKVVIQNEGIARQVMAATAGKTQAEAARAVSELAVAAGYDFTPEEGYTASQEAMAGAGSGELTEADLELVAGGLTTSNGYTTTYTTTGTAQAVGAMAGASGGGAAVGAIAGGVVNGVMNGDPNNSTGTNAALGAGQGYNDFKNTVTNVISTIFSGW